MDFFEMTRTPLDNGYVLGITNATANIHYYLSYIIPVREIGPCVLSRQASRFLAQVKASTHPLNPSLLFLSQQFFSRSLLPLPFEVQVKAMFVFSLALFLNTCPINSQRLRFICCVISSYSS